MKTLLNIKLHLSKKNIFTILVFILVLGGTTGCIQHKSDQKRLPALSFTVNGESFEMIPVEGGTFIMGGTSEQGNDCENNEKPTHEETLPFFYIGKYEVTQKLWKAVMGTDFDQSYNSGCEDCPAEYISWNDTQKFITPLQTKHFACLPILNGNMPHAVASIVKNTNTAEVMISMKLPGILKIIKKVNMETKGLHIR